MLIPMPSLPMQIGPPTEFARRMRIWVGLILGLQFLACFGRIFLFLDILGGFIMVFMIALGWYGWKADMNITFLTSWGGLCLVNGTFDLARCVDIAVHAPNSFFDRELGFAYNLGSVTLIAIPVSCFLGAAVAYFLYRDFESLNTPAPTGEGNDWGAPLTGGGAFGGEGRRLGGGSRGPATQPFQGEGHRLGDSTAPAASQSGAGYRLGDSAEETPSGNVGNAPVSTNAAVEVAGTSPATTTAEVGAAGTAAAAEVPSNATVEAAGG